MKFNFFEKLAIIILMKRQNIAINRNGENISITRACPQLKIFYGVITQPQGMKVNEISVVQAPKQRQYQVEGYKELFRVSRGLKNEKRK